MSTTKPALLLVHGAYHPPECYKPLIVALQAAGFELVAPKLPSLGKGVYKATMKDDVAAVVQAAEPFFISRRTVILLAHAYGAAPATIAAHGFQAKPRGRERQTGGFAGIVYFNGAIPARGGMPMDATAFDLGSVLDTLVLEGEGATSSVRRGEYAMEFFYDPAPQALAEECLALVEPHCPIPFAAPVHVIPADLDMPRTYIGGDKDAIVLLDTQERILADSPGMKAIRLEESGYSSYLSHTSRIVEAVVEMAEELGSR